MKNDITRRGFLKHGGALTAASTVGASWLANFAAVGQAAAANNNNDYKALVCIYMFGGNDGFNTVLPLDDASWARYVNVRKEDTTKEGKLQSLVLDKAQLPRIRHAQTGPEYGLHPALQSVANLYNQNKLAVIANVGTLIKAPMTRDLLAAASRLEVPAKLRSHNDQTAAWQSGKENLAVEGWGGHVVENPTFDFSTASANSFQSVYVTGGTPLFSVGATERSIGLATGANPLPPLLNSETNLFSGPATKAQLQQLIRGLAGGTRTNLLEQDYTTIVNRSLDGQVYLSGALSAVTLDTPTPTDNGLASQLEVVAKVIKTHSNKVGRQIFFVGFGDFDNHDEQIPRQNRYLSQLDTALNYFTTVLGTDLNKVTAFTASEFGRMLSTNGDGTDHGWGSHHFVVGGAVKGGKIYGRMPSYELKPDGSAYVDNNMTNINDNAMIPVVSVGSYAATLGGWFGLSTSELQGMFPYLYNNGGNPLDVGFMDPVTVV